METGQAEGDNGVSEEFQGKEVGASGHQSRTEKTLQIHDVGDRLLISSAGTGRTCALSGRVPRPQPSTR